MPTEALDSEYENGVADVLAHLAGESAAVERNVRFPGRLSGTDRQIDVLVSGHVYGRVNARLAVDAKRWTRPVDVADMGSFIDLVKDVSCDFGVLVTTHGATTAAVTRAINERTIHVETLPITEMLAWRPTGTFIMTYRVSPEEQATVSRALRRAGFRVAESAAWPPTDDRITIEVFRHYGMTRPSADVQNGALKSAQAVMAAAGSLTPALVAHGIVMSGGTPTDRWMEVIRNGAVTGLKLLASNEASAEDQLPAIASTLGVAVEDLSYAKPPGWPSATLFPRLSPISGETA